ncbi:MAG: LysM peptidoglycan-binding domain-containing protein [Ferruginibacter sp.]
MKKILIALFLLPMLAMAQKNKNITPVKMHTVGLKESISSIGRLYEVNGRVLANYNNIDYDKGLTVGQVLKIPPKGTTLEQVSPPVKAEDPKIQPPVIKAETKPITKVETKPAVKAETKNEAGTPIYHTVGKKETLYHISTLYNKVPVEDIKKWNNLTGNGVNEGTKLIVGYSNAAAKTVPPEKIEKPVVIETVKKEPAKQVKETEIIELKTTGKDFKGGVFKTLFESQNANGEPVNQQGTAGVFKSTSGWTDGKYYCLYNNIAPGTIIKITNPANGKSVFAKVLDAIPDIKQNNGLMICISNAAASELGAAETNFNCSLNYSK